MENENYNLNNLYSQRRLALVGTMASVALIASNITLQTDTNLAMFMTGTIVFPSLFNYLGGIQKEINDIHTIKNNMH